jgi:hypothetical protein
VQQQSQRYGADLETTTSIPSLTSSMSSKRKLQDRSDKANSRVKKAKEHNVPWICIKLFDESMDNWRCQLARSCTRQLGSMATQKVKHRHQLGLMGGTTWKSTDFDVW